MLTENFSFSKMNKTKYFMHLLETVLSGTKVMEMPQGSIEQFIVTGTCLIIATMNQREHFFL